jgi:hypothetical protein
VSKVRENRSLKGSESSPVRPNPSHEQIALRAYLIYLERGAVDGDDLEHWLNAETAV